MGRARRNVDGRHVTVLPLRPDAVAFAELERRFTAGLHLRRAVVHEARRLLQLRAESRAFRAARRMPKRTDDERTARNEALNAATVAVRLTQEALVTYAFACRTRSQWIGHHLDAATVKKGAESVWASVEAHMYRGAGRPRIPRRYAAPALVGVPPNANGKTWQSITLRGRYTDPTDVDPHTHRGGWGGYDGRLVLVWNAARGTTRQLVVPVQLAAADSAKGRRQAHALADPAAWREVKVVREEIRGRVRFYAHLLVERPAYVPNGRYGAAPDAVVGVDLGVSTAAVVAVDDTGVTAAVLAAPTHAERDADREAKKRKRRRQRALDRSRRATNPHAYGPDRYGRPGRGSQRRGVRLHPSKGYREKAAVLREDARRAAAERTRRVNELAVTIVSRLGKHVVVEDVRVAGWAKIWGAAVGRFAPSTLVAALRRETSKAGGSFRLVNTRTTALSQHCVCGARTPKPLHQRTHTHDCPQIAGSRLHRDLFSAYLHTAVVTVDRGDGSTRDVLDVSRATQRWDLAAAKGLLAAAASRPGEVFHASGSHPDDDLVNLAHTHPVPLGETPAGTGETGVPVSGGEVAAEDHRRLYPDDDVAATSPRAGGSEGVGMGQAPAAGVPRPAVAVQLTGKVQGNPRVLLHSTG